MKEFFEDIEDAFRCSSCPCKMKHHANDTMEDFIPDSMVSPDSTGRNECNDCVIDMIGLAQAYVPFQTTLNLMDGSQGLLCGTIFSDLVSPYKKGTGLK